MIRERLTQLMTHLTDNTVLGELSFDDKGDVSIDYRPVHMHTLTDEVEVVPLKKRVY